MKKLIFLSLLMCFGLSCTVRHTQPYSVKKRKFKEPKAVELSTKPLSEGSLFNPNLALNNLFTDLRGYRLNDLVIVKIEEQASAERSANTQLTREGSMTAKVNAIMGFLKALEEKNPNLDRKDLMDIATKTAFKGGGSTNRKDKLEATVPAMVKKVFANGNLYIEGSRVVLVNDEEHHFYISGVIRPSDISAENKISSSMIAQAEVEFTGRGVISEKTNQGFLGRILDYIWPF